MESMDWGLCKNIVEGDDCGFQEFESNSLNPLVCGCCECHKHYHMKQESVDFGPCQKKRDGKLCGCQSFLASDCDNKVCSCCEHRQNFHRKRSGTLVLYSGTASSAALNEPDVLTGAVDDLKLTHATDDLKRNYDFQEYIDLSVDSVQRCLKKIKVESSVESPEPKLESPELETELGDDPKVAILRTQCNKMMPPCLMANWKTLEEDSVFGFKKRGLYYPRVSKEKKHFGKWVMFCVSCQVERSINPSFNLLNFKTHLSPKANGVDSVHEKNLKSSLQKEVILEKVALEEKEKSEGIIKKRIEWVQKYAAEGAEMIDKNLWRCSLCSFNGNFGVVDTIGQHVRGGQHLKAKKNLMVGGISSNQMTIHSSFSKGVMLAIKTSENVQTDLKAVQSEEVNENVNKDLL